MNLRRYIPNGGDLWAIGVFVLALLVIYVGLLG